MPDLNIVNQRFLLCSFLGVWFVLWSASVIQDVSILMTGTREKIWILDLDSEDSLYTWFSTLLLAFAALVAFVLSTCRCDHGRNFQNHWKAIGLIFLFLSMDETLSFHERLSGLLDGVLSTSGIFEFAWVIPALIIVSVLTCVFWPFIRQLPYQVARGICLAGVIFVVGAVGMEMVAGLFISDSGATGGIFASPIYRFLASVEEGLEVVGIIIIIKALLMQAEMYFPALFTATEKFSDAPAVLGNYQP